ncbi:reverse transcriptase domain-containing protein [Tanacetum coccineum]
MNEFKHIEPVKQKKRSLAPERNEAIRVIVKELTKANIMREVKYQTWVSNPVIMKKDDGIWKLCIDFMDVNKACPTNHYHLPSADQKVEDLYRFRLKCFLNVYKGYHQIPIDEGDKEKTAFFTREGVFYYKRLPFGLKNAGTARVWFDELPLESIAGYKDFKAAFLAYFMQQKKYVKDLVEIHNIKHRDGETLEDFMERFKVETGRMKGAPECMQVSGFMHGVNNPELTKCLNEHVPKTMEEMMTITTAFIRGETAAASKKKGHAPWKPQDQSKRHVFERKSDFRGQPREGWGSNRFTPPPPH